MASMLPDMFPSDYETQMPSNLQDINLQIDDYSEQEVTEEVAIHQPNHSISFKRGDKGKQHKKFSNTIKDLIDEMNKASMVQSKCHSNQKNKAGKRITMKNLEELF